MRKTYVGLINKPSSHMETDGHYQIKGERRGVIIIMKTTEEEQTVRGDGRRVRDVWF